MIAEIVRSITSNSYQAKDVRTLRFFVVTGSPVWRPGDRVVVSETVIVGKASDVLVAEVVRV